MKLALLTILPFTSQVVWLLLKVAVVLLSMLQRIGLQIRLKPKLMEGTTMSDMRRMMMMFTRPVESSGGTVPVPTISPAAGAILPTQAITISISGIATSAEYSFDNQTWTTYSNPFTLSSATTVYARATDGNDNYSEVVSCVYTILPYDAQVEYLQSSGSQYIETNIKYNVNNSYKIELYGSIGSTSNYALHGWDAGGAFGLYNNKLSNGNTSFGSLNFQGNLLLYNYIINAGTSTQSTLSVNWNGTTYSGSRAHGSLATYARDKGYHLFCTWSNTVRNYYISGKIYYCKIYVNDSLAEDLIPVRVGQVGYMYDKVSGELFGNDGTGNFTYGNDVTI